MEVTGTVIRVGDERQVSEKFKTRNLHLKDDSSKYPQIIEFQFTQDRCELLDKLEVGQTVKVHFNLRGREWTNPQGEVKVFNTLDAWKIDMQDSQESSPTSTTNPSDDLPFQV